MDLKDRAKKFKRLLISIGLAKERSLMTMIEIEKLMLYIQNEYDQKDIMFDEILEHYNYTGRKKTLVNNSLCIAYVGEKAGRPFIKPKLVELFNKTIVEFDKNTDLTDDEIDDEEQGLIYFSPKSQYNDFMHKIEIAFSNKNNKYSIEKVELKNRRGFEKPENIDSASAEINEPVKLKILIQKSLNIPNVGIALKYYLKDEHLVYSRYNHEVEMLPPNTKIYPEGFSSDDEVPGIPLTNFKKCLDSQLTGYYYESTILFPDGSEVSMMVESFIPLQQKTLDVYGFIRLGSDSKSLYLKVFYMNEDNSDKTFHNKFITAPLCKHEFFKFYNFMFNYIKSKKIPMLKRRSDIIIWMEVLKTVVQFGGFDPDRRVHSIYAGFQDVGKSYIVENFNHVKFSNIKIVESSGMTRPGLLGVSNTNIQLPNAKIPGVPGEGAFSGDCIFVEEVGLTIITKSS